MWNNMDQKYNIPYLFHIKLKEAIFNKLMFLACDINL